MPSLHPIARKRGQLSERGQMLGGYIILIFLLVALAATVMTTMTRSRTSGERRYHRELAMNVARMGFEEGLSYFRIQPDGVYLDAYPSTSPASQAWVTPWPTWPDAAFLPKASDTDYYNLISRTTAIGAGAGAIIRTIPLNAFSTTSTAAEAKSSNLWGRYVLRRQNNRNWSPGPNTMAAFSDPEAVRDLTHIRGQSKPGSGNTWGIFSRAYVFTHPTDLTLAAAHEGNSILNSPKRYYNGKPLLLATASVYGELSRINFNLPSAATFVAKGLTVNANANLSGQGQARMARRSGGSAYVNGGQTSGGDISAPADPSVGYVFPGLTVDTLKEMAAALDPTKVGGIECFPLNTDSDFSDDVSRTSFYFITTTATTPANTITFVANNPRVMSGVGLVYIDGNLVIEHRNSSDWAGVVFVNGNVNVRGPGTISGILIATGAITLGASGDFNRTSIEYNEDAINTVQSYLQDFQVLSSSILTTSNSALLY